MILVTGGAGFIGSNIVAALSDRGRDVSVCDYLGDDDKWRNIAKHEIDEVIHPSELDQWLIGRERLDAVVHMGAISSTTVRDADAVYRNNVSLSSRIWQWCVEHRTSFIYASSAATYGGGQQGFDDDGTVSALARLRPLNAYGWSKHFFDRRVARWIAAGRPSPPQWIGLKFFNVYGPNEYHKGLMQSVVAQKYPLVAEGRPVTLFKSHHPDYADGGQLRDFIYVRDCVDVVLWLLDNRQVNGLFNLGTGKSRSFADLVRAIAIAAEAPLRVEYVQMPESIRPNYQYFTQADVARLRAAGYSKAFTSLEEGVSHYVENFLAAADHYR